MKISERSVRGVLSVALVITGLGAACAPLGGIIDDSVGYPSSDETVSGEVRSIGNGRIQVREEYGGTLNVRYDSRTRVVYRQRQYPVSYLERGDYVRMRLAYDRNNAAWADYVEVRESARNDRDRDRDDRDRDRGTTGRIERLDGNVGRIDTRRDYFTLERSRNSSVVVRITGNTRRDDVRRFERLRRGERVRVEIRHLGRDNAELIRFR